MTSVLPVTHICDKYKIQDNLGHNFLLGGNFTKYGCHKILENYMEENLFSNITILVFAANNHFHLYQIMKKIHFT